MNGEQKRIGLIFLSLLLFSPLTWSMKLDQVILSTNTDPAYYDFWPFVAKAWTKLIGIKPVLAYICDGEKEIDESLGEVIKFETIPGIPVSFQARTIRLLLPAYFENKVSIISDIDMLPIEKSYFFDSLRPLPNDRFVVYTDKIYNPQNPCFRLCYNAALGKTFKEIFGISDEATKDLDTFKKYAAEIIKTWYCTTLGICSTLKLDPGLSIKIVDQTDERMLSMHLKTWGVYEARCVRLGRTADREITTSPQWHYYPGWLLDGYYRDANLPKPYNHPENKKKIDQLLKDLGLEIPKES